MLIVLLFDVGVQLHCGSLINSKQRGSVPLNCADGMQNRNARLTLRGLQVEPTPVFRFFRKRPPHTFFTKSVHAHENTGVDI